MVVVSTLHREGDNALGDKGKLRLVSRLHFVFVLWLLHFHTSHIVVFGFVCRWQGEQRWKGSELQCEFKGDAMWPW